MDYSLEEIIAFLEIQIGNDNLSADTNLFADVGVDGDDFHEMINAFAEKFSVDMSQYRWYFHTGEEGLPFIGQLFFPPPNRRVQRIPITPIMLTEMANQGKWNIIYPEHKIPEKRYDLIINRIIAIAVSLLLLLMLSIKYGHKYEFW